MKISSPPASICTLTESISNQVRSIVQRDIDQELQHWLTNNLLPSLAWLAADHLSSCIAIPTDLCNSVVYHLSTLLQLTTDILDTINQKEGSSDDRAKLLPSYLQRKTRQMNILVYIITRSVLQLMSDSMEYLKQTQSSIPNEDADKDTSFSEDADLDISSSVVWIDDKDYQLCITLSSKVECNIENCVATITNINGTGGNTDIKVTHYTLLEQSEWVHKVYFETILPRQHRKILILGRNVSCATFTVTIQDSVQRWKDNPKLQPRLLSAISTKLKVKDSDLQVLQVLKATDDESECVVVLLRLFSPSARTLLRTLRKHQNCIDFHLLNVVDIREGMPAECMHLYGTPELSINVCSSGIATNTILETDTHFLEDPPPNRRISFSSVSKVERNWTADIFISDSIPQIDTLVVQEELFRQEIVHILTTRLPTDDNPNFNCKEIVDEIYQLVEKKYISITNSNFVKELLFQLSIWGNNLAELRYMGESISQQSHRGGKQEMCSTNKSPTYQQVVNLFMNVYILRHHLHLTSTEHMEQIQDEVNSTMDDEVMTRRQTVQQEQDERAGIELLARLPPSRNISPMISESVITQVPANYYKATSQESVHHEVSPEPPNSNDTTQLHTFHPSQLRLPDEPSNLSPANSSPSSVDNSPKHSISVGSVSPINTYGSLVTQAPVEFSSPASPPFSYIDSPSTVSQTSSPSSQTAERVIPLPPETTYGHTTQIPLPPMHPTQAIEERPTTQEIYNDQVSGTPDFMVMNEPLDDDYQSGMEDNTALTNIPLDSDYNSYSQDTEILVNEENLSTLPNMSDESPTSYLDTITTPKHPDVILPPSQHHNHIPLSIPPRSVSPTKKPKPSATNENNRIPATRRIVARPTPPIDINKAKTITTPQMPSTPRDDYKKDTASASLKRTPVTPRESSVNVTPSARTPVVRDSLAKPRTPSSDRRPSTPRNKDLEKEKENRPTRIPVSTTKDPARSVPKLPAKAMMALARLSPRESVKPTQQTLPLGRRASGSRESIAPRIPNTPRDPSPLTPRTTAPATTTPKTTPMRKTTSSGLPITTRTSSSMRSSSADRASPPKEDIEVKRPMSARHRSSSENSPSTTTPIRTAMMPIPSPARMTTPKTNIQARITIPSPRSKMETVDPSFYNNDVYEGILDQGTLLNTPRPKSKTSPRTSPRNSTSHMPVYEAPVPVSTRKEIMRLREETTRERVRAKELVTKRRLETQAPTSTKQTIGTFANQSKQQDLILKKEKRRKELEKLEEERRCDELHQFLKGAAFDWMPAQPPPPPPTTILLTELSASYPLEWCRDMESLSGTAVVF